MKRVCCGCGLDMGIAPGPDDHITHGLCELCVDWIQTGEEELLERRASLQVSLDGLTERLQRLEEHLRRRARKGGPA